MLIALATVSVAISSPVCQLLIPLNEIILIKLYLSVYLDVQAYDFFSKWRVSISTVIMLIELPFQRQYDRQHVKLSTTKLRENEKENKNSGF